MGEFRGKFGIPFVSQGFRKKKQQLQKHPDDDKVSTRLAFSWFINAVMLCLQNDDYPIFLRVILNTIIGSDTSHVQF